MFSKNVIQSINDKTWLGLTIFFGAIIVILEFSRKVYNTIRRGFVPNQNAAEQNQAQNQAGQNVGPQNLAVGPQNLAVGPQNLAVGPQNLAVGPQNLAGQNVSALNRIRQNLASQNKSSQNRAPKWK